MPRDVSLSDSKCCENATVGTNGLKNYNDQPYSCPRGLHISAIIGTHFRTPPENPRTSPQRGTERFKGALNWAQPVYFFFRFV